MLEHPYVYNVVLCGPKFGPLHSSSVHNGYVVVPDLGSFGLGLMGCDFET